ncbi:MAG: lantibiotic dehydratase [Parachlamydiaceae bacterium]|nr:MAG: lantibiotic dehydratase [Parachlamydiaceae bacterium]
MIEKICEVLKEYADQKPGEGISTLQDLLELADTCKGIDHPIRVDSYLNESELLLPKHIKSNLEEIASILSHLTNHLTKSEHISKYYRQFTEKYGTTRLVPIKELISPTMGLDVPSC